MCNATMLIIKALRLHYTFIEHSYTYKINFKSAYFKHQFVSFIIHTSSFLYYTHELISLINTLSHFLYMLN